MNKWTHYVIKTKFKLEILNSRLTRQEDFTTCRYGPFFFLMLFVCVRLCVCEQIIFHVKIRISGFSHSPQDKWLELRYCVPSGNAFFLHSLQSSHLASFSHLRDLFSTGDAWVCKSWCNSIMSLHSCTWWPPQCVLHSSEMPQSVSSVLYPCIYIFSHCVSHTHTHRGAICLCLVLSFPCPLSFSSPHNPLLVAFTSTM